MTCRHYPGVITCGPAAGVHTIVVRYCDRCDCRTHHVEAFDGVWYGTTWHCTACETTTDSDGFTHPRPTSGDYAEAHHQRILNLQRTAITRDEYDRQVELARHLEFDCDEEES